MPQRRGQRYGPVAGERRGSEVAAGRNRRCLEDKLAVGGFASGSTRRLARYRRPLSNRLSWCLSSPSRHRRGPAREPPEPASPRLPSISSHQATALDGLVTNNGLDPLLERSPTAPPVSRDKSWPSAC